MKNTKGAGVGTSLGRRGAIMATNPAAVVITETEGAGGTTARYSATYILTINCYIRLLGFKA